ncbi:MAG: insulinase family protein [Bacteroides sp.]|nr:insulinase family protein [Bacteroides sp.]
MIEYNTFTLDNGLRAVHNYDPSTAMVAVNVLYNVGARDESPSLTGLAHLFEHLMFGGSVNIPDFDAAIERAGGTNNAWTSNDFTNFYDVAPAANFETLLWLESDRMLGLAFSPKSLEVQQSVVIEEFKQTHLNRPYGDVAHRLRELLYTSHPYRYPAIGKEISHIADVTLDDVRQFFYSHYAPNNAVVAVSGNVTLDEARRGLEKWFGPIPRRDIAPRLYAPEPAVEAPRTVTVNARVPQPLVVVAYPMAAHGQPGYIEADIITDILASGRSSRFYRDIVMSDPLFTEADASIAGSDEPGFLMLRGRLTDSSPEAVERAVYTLTTQAAALREHCAPHELERAVNRFDSNHRFSMQHYLSRAQELSMSLMQGEDINRRVEAYRAVTTDRITEVARRVLDPARACTLIYLPEE